MQRRYGRQIAIRIMMCFMLSVAVYGNDASDTALVNEITDCVSVISSNSIEIQSAASETAVASESIAASETAAIATESVDAGEAAVASESVTVSETTIASETVVASQAVLASGSAVEGDVITTFESAAASKTDVASESAVSIASSSVETADSSLPEQTSPVWKKTAEWFWGTIASYTLLNQGVAIASEPVSMEDVQPSVCKKPDSMLDIIYKNYKGIIENRYFDIVREALKSEDEIFATMARLDLPSDANLKSVKNLNQSFRFVFPCKMMDYQGACATITPGLIKEETWSSDYRSLTIVPEQMKIGTEYTITLATATLNADGYPLKEAAIINFTTYSPEPASITMITPMNNAKNVATGATIILSFSKEIIWDPDYSPASFSVYNESSMQYVPLCPITAFNQKTLALIPEKDLDIDSKYSVNVFEGIKTFVEDVGEGQPEVASATFTFFTSY